jgi:hypothetical protein
VATNGPIVKINDILDDERLRVGGDMPGQGGRIVYRGEALRNADLQAGR